MKNKPSTLQIRIDKKTKDDAQKILASMGIDMSSAIKLFLRNIIITESIPLELRTKSGMLAERKCELLRDVTRVTAESKNK